MAQGRGGGRKSRAAQEIEAVASKRHGKAGRPAAPPELPAPAAAEWRKLVDGMPAGHFKAETLGLLAQYCRHLVACNRVAKIVTQIEGEPNFNLTAYDKALSMQARETQMLCSLATKMRIAQTSGGKKKATGPGGPLPWEDDDV